LQIYYKAVSTGSSTLPSFLTFDQENLVFDWSSATSANVGTYSIKLTGYIGTGRSTSATWSLVVDVPCTTTLITPSTTSVSISYFVNTPTAAPTIITLPTFSSNTSVAWCGAF